MAECSKGHFAILSTFIKLPFVIKIFDLSIFEWPFYTGFTVLYVACYECKGFILTVRLKFHNINSNMTIIEPVQYII